MRLKFPTQLNRFYRKPMTFKIDFDNLIPYLLSAFAVILVQFFCRVATVGEVSRLLSLSPMWKGHFMKFIRKENFLHNAVEKNGLHVTLTHMAKANNLMRVRQF